MRLVDKDRFLHPIRHSYIPFNRVTYPKFDISRRFNNMTIPLLMMMRVIHLKPEPTIPTRDGFLLVQIEVHARVP